MDALVVVLTRSLVNQQLPLLRYVGVWGSKKRSSSSYSIGRSGRGDGSASMVWDITAHKVQLGMACNTASCAPYYDASPCWS